MVRVRKTAFVNWKATVVHRGRTSTSVRRHNVLQPDRIEVVHTPMVLAVDEQPTEPDPAGPAPATAASARARKAQDVQAWMEIRSSLHMPA